MGGVGHEFFINEGLQLLFIVYKIWNGNDLNGVKKDQETTTWRTVDRNRTGSVDTVSIGPAIYIILHLCHYFVFSLRSHLRISHPEVIMEGRYLVNSSMDRLDIFQYSRHGIQGWHPGKRRVAVILFFPSSACLRWSISGSCSSSMEKNNPMN